MIKFASKDSNVVWSKNSHPPYRELCKELKVGSLANAVLQAPAAPAVSPVSLSQPGPHRPVLVGPLVTAPAPGSMLRPAGSPVVTPFYPKIVHPAPGLMLAPTVKK